MNKSELKVGVDYAVHRREARFSSWRVGGVDRARYLGEVDRGARGRYMGGGQYARTTHMEFEIVKPGSDTPYPHLEAGQKFQITKAGHVWSTWEAFQVDLVRDEHDRRRQLRQYERENGATDALGLSGWYRDQLGRIAVSGDQLIAAAQRHCGYEPPPEIPPFEETAGRDA